MTQLHTKTSRTSTSKLPRSPSPSKRKAEIRKAIEGLRRRVCVRVERENGKKESLNWIYGGLIIRNDV